MTTLPAPQSIYIIGDGISNCFNGIIQGVGKQTPAAVVCLVSYYMIGLPVSREAANGGEGQGAGSEGWQVMVEV